MKYTKMEDLRNIYNKNTKYNSLKDKTANDSLKICGDLIDSAYFLKEKKGLEKALQFLKELEEKKLTDLQEGTLYYYIGNVYADIDALTKKQTTIIEWENKNKELVIYNYRKALTKKLNAKLRAQILINLGNLYNSLGRFVKSVELYDNALKEDPKNQMAYGNKGIALFYYGLNLYDEGHKTYFMYYSYQSLKRALSLEKYGTDAKNAFTSYYNELTEWKVDKIKNLKLDDFSFGRSNSEKEYRKWCLANRIFLNPLNDLGNHSVANHDVLHLPNMILDINKSHIEFPSFYNQLKQEFVSARYLIFEGMENIGKNHFSDKNVILINPLDYPRYSLNIEKIKISFKMLYSIFDKISLFLRKYLGINFKRDYGIDFRKMWYDESNFKKRVINQKITSMDNWAFRGLFLISKELLFHHPDREEDEKLIKELSYSLEPSAKEINLLRNHLEHGHVKIHEDFYNPDNSTMFKDNICYSISETDLKKYCLKLIKLSREALINLSIGVHIEEKKKKQGSSGKYIPEIHSDIYEDNWKY